MNFSDFLPPIAYRAMKATRDRFAAPAEKKLHFDAFDRTLSHRGSDADLGVLHQIFTGKDYDFSRLRRCEDISRYYADCENPLIVDAGANIGASSVWFSMNFPKAIIKSVEPHPENFSFLEKNVIGLNVVPIHGALASNGGRISLFNPGQGEWGFRTGDSEGVLLGDVEALTIDDLICPNEMPFVLKIDIEGGEKGLFDSLGESFDKFPVVVIELHDWLLPGSRSSESFLRWHSSRNRDFVHIGENVFSISNSLPMAVGS